MVNCSPTTALAGRAPPSTTGLTPWTGIRPMGTWGWEVVGACVGGGVVGALVTAGLWPVLPALGASGGLGMAAGGFAVTRPTLLGWPPAHLLTCRDGQSPENS